MVCTYCTGLWHTHHKNNGNEKEKVKQKRCASHAGPSLVLSNLGNKERVGATPPERVRGPGQALCHLPVCLSACRPRGRWKEALGRVLWAVGCSVDSQLGWSEPARNVALRLCIVIISSMVPRYYLFGNYPGLLALSRLPKKGTRPEIVMGSMISECPGPGTISSWNKSNNNNECWRGRVSRSRLDVVRPVRA